MGSDPTFWTVLIAIPEWQPKIVKQIGNGAMVYTDLLSIEDPNADALAKLAVIDGLRAWYTNPFGSYIVRFEVRDALLTGTDQDLIAAALAVAELGKETTDAKPSPPPSTL